MWNNDIIECSSVERKSRFFPNLSLFLGAIEKLRKATISFVTCVRPSARNSSAPTGRNFMKSDIGIFFGKLSRRLKFHWRLTRIAATVHADRYTFFIVSRSVVPRMRNVSDTSCGYSENTRFIFSIFFFFFENRAGYAVGRFQPFVGHKGPYGAHTRTSLASESDWARVPMSQTRPCVWNVTSRTWPILAWLVRTFGGARLAAGLLLARTCVGDPKPDSHIHTATNTDSASFVTKEEPCRLPCLKHSWVLTFSQSFVVFRTIISNKIQ
jgi:hypothetical protein